MLNRCANSLTVLLNVMLVNQLLHLVIKRNKKKETIYLLHILKLVEDLHSAVAAG